MQIPEALKKVLTEEQLTEIKAEFDKQVQIAVESALHKYDDEAVKRISDLEAQINESHARKLSLIRSKYNTLLESIQKKHEEALTKEADAFKIRIAEQVEKFVNSKVNSIVNFDVIKEAAKNKTAAVVLESLRKQLAVDSALMQESVRKPLGEIKGKMAKAVSLIKSLKAENTRLNESLNTANAYLLIENKVAGLNEKEASHMRRMLTGKSVEYINEQFDYIRELYAKGQEVRRDNLKKDAIATRKATKRNIPEARRTRDLIPESTRIDHSEAALIREIAGSMAEEF